MSDNTTRPVAFVTGACSGIGKATARLFLEAGYAVALADINARAGADTEAEFASIGPCKYLACDVSDDASVAAAVQACVESLGPFSAVFNAAGIDGEHGKATADTSAENWHRVIGIDLTGMWHCLRHQIPVMLANGGGAIVNCASVAGVVGAPFLSPYVAAKHGVVGLTRCAALEYARQGIRVNAVCPGMIDTPMSRASMNPELHKMLIEQSAIGRLGNPEEVGAAVLWLCSAGASFVTGQILPVDGAWTAA
ncbi:SDR family NAD(P)-dependent oxidoreductase [Haliea sp. E17]|uniref:SDR family NAD(P)-dependent oxidoreductase n=1 Tax=Haliea sp. E17 TaxID=3401576 RepID=UPI003AAB9827